MTQSRRPSNECVGSEAGDGGGAVRAIERPWRGKRCTSGRDGDQYDNKPEESTESALAIPASYIDYHHLLFP
jgi:hypothetical protein